MPKVDRYPVSFAFRLEEHVATRLRVVAEAHGYKPAEWARKIVSEAIDEGFERRAVRLRVLHADLLRTYLAELARQGNNLNQIARALNARETRSNAMLQQELDAIRSRTETIMIAVLDALGADAQP